MKLTYWILILVAVILYLWWNCNRRCKELVTANVSYDLSNTVGGL